MTSTASGTTPYRPTNNHLEALIYPQTLTEMGDTMGYRLSTVATAAFVVLSGSGAMAAELPTYEIMGFPISQHQLVTLNTAQIQESLLLPTLTLGGMPASPHQIAVLTSRLKQQIAVQERAAVEKLKVRVILVE